MHSILFFCLKWLVSFDNKVSNAFEIYFFSLVAHPVGTRILFYLFTHRHLCIIFSGQFAQCTGTGCPPYAVFPPHTLPVLVPCPSHCTCSLLHHDLLGKQQCCGLWHRRAHAVSKNKCLRIIPLFHCLKFTYLQRQLCSP